MALFLKPMKCTISQEYQDHYIKVVNMARYGQIYSHIRYTSTMRRGCRLFDEFRRVLFYLGNKNKTLKIKVSSSCKIVLLKFIFTSRGNQV